MRPLSRRSRLLLLFFCSFLLPTFATSSLASNISVSPSAYIPIVSFYGSVLPIRDMTFTYTSAPAVSIWGEMVNTSNQVLTAPTVIITPPPNNIGDSGVFVSTGFIDPGGLVAFHITLAGITPSMPITVTPSFIPEQLNTTLPALWFRRLTITNSQYQTLPTSQVTGVIKNENPTRLIHCGAVVVLYDAHDHVIGMVDIKTNKPSVYIQEGPGLILEANEELAFWADIPAELPVARYRIDASGFTF